MSSSVPSLSRPLAAMALGRIVLGAASLASPAATARSFGARASGELDYMTRIYGARAIALGLAYLMAGPDERARMQRLSLGVDVSDTLTGLSMLVRGAVTPRGGPSAPASRSPAAMPRSEPRGSSPTCVVVPERQRSRICGRLGAVVHGPCRTRPIFS